MYHLLYRKNLLNTNNNKNKNKNKNRDDVHIFYKIVTYDILMDIQ